MFNKKGYKKFFNENFSDEEIGEFAFRQVGHFNKILKNKKRLSAFDIIESFFILQQIEENRVVFKLYVFDEKFSLVIKEKLQNHATDIWEMYVSGKGETAIESALLSIHKVKLSKTTIKKFLLSNFEYRKNARIKMDEIKKIEEHLKNKKSPASLKKANEARKAKKEKKVDEI